MKFNFLCLSLTGLLLGSITTTMAVTVKGKVVDYCQAKAIGDAKVTVNNVVNTTTDSQGNFVATSSAIKKGDNFIIVITKPGYKEYKDDFGDFKFPTNNAELTYQSNLKLLEQPTSNLKFQQKETSGAFTIKGKVVDACTGKPVQGEMATYGLVSVNDGYQAVPNANGEFLLNVSPLDENEKLILKASYLGFIASDYVLKNAPTQNSEITLLEPLKVHPWNIVADQIVFSVKP